MDINNNFTTLSAETRVWIYQSNRPFSTEEAGVIKSAIADFAQGWVSHNQALKTHGDLYHNQFVVLMVDESQAGASGCSIDSSVKFIRHLQQQLGVDFFDRMTFAWKEGDVVKTAHRSEFANLYKEGAINESTLVFDNLVTTKGDFEEKWVKPLGESWHARMV
ncbi:MAG: hypothetical protein ACI8YQ_003453 [Polaribacter sp.]|jgi:hypothetical protein